MRSGAGDLAVRCFTGRVTFAAEGRRRRRPEVKPAQKRRDDCAAARPSRLKLATGLLVPEEIAEDRRKARIDRAIVRMAYPPGSSYGLKNPKPGWKDEVRKKFGIVFPSS